MGKSIIAFLVLTLVFGFGIKAFVSMKLKEKWALTKVVGYAMLCSALAITVLSLVVAFF